LHYLSAGHSGQAAKGAIRNPFFNVNAAETDRADHDRRQFVDHVRSAAPHVGVSAAFAGKQLAQLGPLQWHRLAPSRAFRVTLGVVLPLAIGWISGHVGFGAYMALGALPAGFASFQGETRSRLAAVALATVGMALSTFVGATTAASAPWLLVPIIALWAYVVGLSVCLGPAASVAALQWAVALLISVGLPMDPAEAALRAALVLAGGALQALLVAASWTFRPGKSERAALAASYRALARYASGVAAGTTSAPPPTAFPASSVLDDPNPLLPRPVRMTFIDLLEQAERVRASLAALATDADHEAMDAGEIRTLMTDAASTLNLIAQALGSPRADRDALVRELNARITALTVAAHVKWRWSGEALLGQLRAAGRMMAYLAASKQTDAAAPAETAALRNQDVIASTLATMRANMTTTTEAGRHALRLAVVATLAEAIAQVTGLHQGRWVALTIFIVLKPDYRSTFSRGVQRALGTALGAALGAVVAELSHPGQGGLIVAAGVSAAAAYALFEVSYLMFSVPLTLFIVMLLALLGMPAVPTAEARIFDTFIGAALGLIAYLVWPTWEGSTAQEKFAQLIEAHRDYATGLLCELARPSSVQPAALRALQAAARRARSDAEAATARVRDEPTKTRLTPDFAQMLIATVSRLAHAELALHALAVSRFQTGSFSDAPREGLTHLDDLRESLALGISRIAAALRTPEKREPIPPLRPIYTALASEPTRDAPLVALVDRLIDATNTLDAMVRDRLVLPGGSAGDSGICTGHTGTR
jgi:uncharacterized membrane protein YccC